MKFKPQLIIFPGRMVRMQALGPNECGAETRIDLAGCPMGVLDIRNVVLYQLLQEWVKEVMLPVLSNMVILERICPAIGINPVPLVKDHGTISSKLI